MAAKEYAEVKLSEIVAEGNVRELDAGSPAFKELVASVMAQGVLEPVLLAKLDEGGYELVAGFRRVAAAKEAKLLTVPARIMDLTPVERAEVRLIENLTRTDLSPMEEARGIHAYSELTGAKPKEIAAKLSKSETYIRERLKLLNLAPAAQKLLATGKLGAKQAIALATIPAETQAEVLDGFDTDGVPLTGEPDEIFKDEIARERQVAEARAKAREQVKGAKFPKCPKCGADADGPFFVDGSKAKLVQDEDGHGWDPATGQAVSRRAVIDANPTVREERETRRAERYDRSVSPAIGLAKRPWEILKAIIEEAADDVEEVQITEGGWRRGNDRGLVITVHVDNAPDVVGKLPGNFGVRLFPMLDPKGGHVTQAVATPPSAKDRKATLKVVRQLAPELPEVKGLDQLPDLDKPVADVVAWIGGYEDNGHGGRSYKPRKKGEEDWREKRGFIALLRATEAANKNRGSVLDAFDNLLGANTPTSQTTDY